MSDSPAELGSSGLTFYFPATELHVDAADTDLLRRVGNALMRSVFDRPFENARPSRRVRVYCRRAATPGAAPSDRPVSTETSASTAPSLFAWSPEPGVRPARRALERSIRDGEAVARLREVGDGLSVLLELPPSWLERGGESLERFLEQVVDATLPADSHLWVDAHAAIGFAGHPMPRPECLLLTGDEDAVDCAARALAAQSFDVSSSRRQRLVAAGGAIALARRPAREELDRISANCPEPLDVTRILHFESATRPWSSSPGDRLERIRRTLLDRDRVETPELDAAAAHPILEVVCEQAEIFKVIWQPEEPHSAARTTLKLLGLHGRAVSSPRTWRVRTPLR